MSITTTEKAVALSTVLIPTLRDRTVAAWAKQNKVGYDTLGAQENARRTFYRLPFEVQEKYRTTATREDATEAKALVVRERGSVWYQLAMRIHSIFSGGNEGEKDRMTTSFTGINMRDGG